MSDQTSLGREIRRLRGACGLTVQELASRAGMRDAYVAAIEEDREEPSAGALRRLAVNLEPAGASYDSLAMLLVGPEFDAAGEYTHLDQHQPNASSLPTGGGAAKEQGSSRERLLAAERVWGNRNDLQLLDAATRINEYSPEARSAILLQLARRRLGFPSSAGAAPVGTQSLSEPAAAGIDFGGAAGATSCALCFGVLVGSYYQVNGRIACSSCCERLRQGLNHANEGSGVGRAARAAGAGLVAAAGGSTIYFVILVATGYEIGLVAVLIGYMVGRAVNWGSRGRGGWRYQALAMMLTYFSFVSSFVPLMIREFAKQGSRAQTASARTVQGDAAPSSVASTAGGSVTGAIPGPLPTGSPRTTAGKALLALALLFLLACALPFLGGLQGLLGIFIIGIGIYEAWKFNRRRVLDVSGPYALNPVGLASPAT